MIVKANLLESEIYMTESCGAWYPTVFPEKCDGCVKFEKPCCIEFCPNGVFMLQNGEIAVAYPYKCVNGCKACEPVCPKKAITFPKKDTVFAEAKSDDRSLLRKTACPECGKVFWTNRDVDVCMDCEGKG